METSKLLGLAAGFRFRSGSALGYHLTYFLLDHHHTIFEPAGITSILPTVERQTPARAAS